MKQFLLFDLEGLLKLSAKGKMSMFYSLKRRGFKMGTFSEESVADAMEILKKSGLSMFFSVVEGCNKKEKKNDAAKRALKKLADNSEKVFLIGNEELDVTLSERLGVESISVAEWEEAVFDMMEAHVDYIVRSVDELHEFLLREVRQDLGKIKGVNRVWSLFYPVALFLLVRALVQFTAVGVKQFFAGNVSSNTNLMSGNEVAIYSAISFMIAALVVGGIAGVIISYVKSCMKLKHLFGAGVSQYLTLVVSVVGYALGMNILLNLIFVGKNIGSYEQVASTQYSASIIVGLIAYGVCAPIAEEILFRGIVYGYLRSFFGTTIGIFVSGILFGVYHMNLVQGIYAFVMGCVFAFAYEYFCSFRVPVLLHIGVNSITYLLTNLVPDQSFLMNIPIMVTCLSFGVIGTVLLLKQQK